jgi:hypothetical protein
VKVTVARDAVPRRRSATLADDAFVASPTDPAPGGPADRRTSTTTPPPGIPDRRTPVRSPIPAASGAIGVPVRGGEDPMLAALRAQAASSADPPSSADAFMALPTTAGPATRAMAIGGSTDPAIGRRATAVATAPVLSASRDEPGPVADPSIVGAIGSTTESSHARDATPCGDLRRTADERCELAGRARSAAAAAEEHLRVAKRAYDDHEARAEQATRTVDPRAVRDAKDHAQAHFRTARADASTADEVDVAASAWLMEINRINAEAREAHAVAVREHEAARAIALELDRLAVEADAARINAETAEAACLAARERAAECEEHALGLEAAAAIASAPPPGLRTADDAFASQPGAGRSARIFRLLRGDRAALGEVVAAMAGDDAEARRRWQIALSDLVDAIVADAIAESALEFPTEHMFWGTFTIVQDRDIAQALSALGFRFDGLGGWVDGRVPSQRDLSLALGYAGIDPMRIRHWPTETDIQDLYREVAVMADRHLASKAGDLTLGELVTMLGRRADGLAETWNHWGRLRPILLEER